MTQALSGVRVIDLSMRLSGAYAARMFGDFGADVILAEPADGHALRHEAPFMNDEAHPENSVLHAYANWNKRSIVVKDAAEFAKLVSTANVVITTDFPPWNPDLTAALESLPSDAIHLSITPHGLTGPLASVPGNNLTTCARTAWAPLNGLLDEPPLQLPNHQTGYTSGVAGFVGAMGALFRANQTHIGERVDVSELEAMAMTNAPWAIKSEYKGEKDAAYGPHGPRIRGKAAPLYTAGDGQLNLGIGDWPNWRDSMNLLGLTDLAVDPVYEPYLGRHETDLDPVKATLAEAVADRKKWELFHGLAKLRSIAGVVQNSAEALENEHFNAREFFVETEFNGRKMRAPGPPVKLHGSPWQHTRSAPKLNEDRESIRSEIKVANAKTPARPASPNGKAALPLAGVRVLTFTQAWSGTFATELLALLGADVVQVEACKRPDIWRGAGAPVLPGVVNPNIKQNRLNCNGMYNSVNLNKRAITLDMKHPKGKEIFWRMLPHFDILADNFSPHVMESWGITLESLREHRKDIIFASLSGYGHHGPYSEYAANGSTTEPMGLLSSVHGYEGDPGMNTGGLLPDPVCAYYYAAAMLVALSHRQRTGEGQRIDLSMMEAFAVQFGDAVLEYEANKDIRKPRGNSHPTFAPHGIYAAKNSEWLAVAAETDAMWKSLATYMGAPELVDDPRFKSVRPRQRHRKELDAIMEDWCKDRDPAEEEEKLGAMGICAARVMPFVEVYRKPNEQFCARDFFVPITHPESGTHLLPRVPWHLPGTEELSLRYSPRFGEHSQEVFREEAGIGEEEYQELLKAGITGTEQR